LYQNKLPPTRLRERIARDRDEVYAVLDEALVSHVGLVVDGRPQVLPTLHVRVRDTLYVHGSVAARLPASAARAGAGLPVCVTVTLIDGIVFARSAFHHSVNYRSVVVHADATPLDSDAIRRSVLDALVDRVGTDRSRQCRPPSRRELAATAVLAVPLTGDLADVALKRRTGPPGDDEADLALPHWAGVVPLRLAAGQPEPDPTCQAPVPPGLLPALT
jgi:uncharacterized protein